VSDDPPPDVHFVAGAGDPGVDEELAQPPQRTFSRGVRLRLEFAAAAAGLALVAVVIHNRTEHHASNAAEPTTSVAPTTSPLPSVVTLPPVARNTPIPQLDVFPVCPEAGDGQPSCVTVRSVPDPFVAAVRELLPRIQTSLAVTENLRASAPQDIPGLWSRLFTGRSGTTTIRILVQRGGDPVPVVLAPSARGTHVLIGRHRATPYYVQVQMVSTSAAALSQHDVDQLARDARLIAS
jgi:hypothetical protein